jgi:sugar lactone lactonase YvrE
MVESRTFAAGIAFGESPRWGPDDRLWLSDWGAGDVLAVGDGDVEPEVMARLDFRSFRPFCIDWTPDGRDLVIVAPDRLLRREADGSLVAHADLSGVGPGFWNEIVVDGRGNAYLNDVGFNMPAGERPRPGTIALLTPDGSVRQVGDGLMFPNGMVVTADNSTLICAESYAKKLTR